MNKKQRITDIPSMFAFSCWKNWFSLAAPNSSGCFNQKFTLIKSHQREDHVLFSRPRSYGLVGGADASRAREPGFSPRYSQMSFYSGHKVVLRTCQPKIVFFGASASFSFLFTKPLLYHSIWTGWQDGKTTSETNCPVFDGQEECWGILSQSITNLVIQSCFTIQPFSHFCWFALYSVIW